MSGIEREVFFCERCEAIGEEYACSCDDKGRWVTLVVTAAENLTRAERERDEARADAARWKAEAERLREAIKPRGRSAGGGTDA